MTKKWRIADSDPDFVHFKLKRDDIAPVEDGRRSDSRPGHFEWWYADAILQDKTYVVVVFFTKPISDQSHDMAPRVAISIAEPGKAVVIVNGDFTDKDFEADAKGCDVRIGASRFTGDLEEYTIVAQVKDVKVRMTLTRQGESLRLGTGHLMFQEKDERFFAWLPSVPRAAASVTYSMRGAPERTLPGMGYHDHNWGDAPLGELMHHWYWARALIGGHTVIAAHIVPQPQFGDEAFDLLYIEKDGKVLVKDYRHVQFSSFGAAQDTTTLKPFFKHTEYTLDDGQTQFKISFDHAKTLQGRLFDEDSRPPSDPDQSAAYHRFGGMATLQISGAGAPPAVDLPPTPALWELMWLGAQQDSNALALYARALTIAEAKFTA